MPDYQWVGKPITQIDIDGKLNGRARYVADLRLPGMLDAAIVRSPIAHGRIRSVDVSRAVTVPGVRAAITAADTPRIPFGPFNPDWEILAGSTVRFIGDEIAAVAATSAEAARAGAAAVTADFDELPATFDPAEALRVGAPPVWDEHPDNVCTLFTIERGDVDGGFRRAARTFQADYSTSRVYHAYLEPIGAIADWTDDRCTLYLPTHIPYRARLTYATALGLPLEKIRIVIPEIGGSFGAKYEMNMPLIAAVLSRRAGRPVRIVYDREQDAAFAHPRTPFWFHHRLAVDASGTFLARETDVIGAAGARTYWSPVMLATAVHRVDALYHFHAVRGRGRLAYTNENPTTCMRGFGNAEALFGIEQMIDDIAEEMGIDPFEIRQRNIVRQGDTTLHGWKVTSSQLPTCLDHAAEISRYRDARRPTPAPRAADGPRPPGSRLLRGIGLAIGHHVTGYRSIVADYDGSSAILRLGGDGDITLLVGEPDIGQGHATVLAQLVAERLGTRPSAVHVHGIDTALSPAAVGTLASRGATLAGNAALAAADDAISRTVAFVAQQWGLPAERLLWRNGSVLDATGAHAVLPLDQALRWHAAVNCGMPVLGEGVFRPATQMPDDTGYGNPSIAYPFAAHIAEVEVDPDSGQVHVTRYWAVHDSGTILNPSTARGQVLGGIAQGIGWALQEDVVARDGRVANPNFLDYRIPGPGDMPSVTVEFVDSCEPDGPLGAKSIGEVALDPVTAAIANAIHNATGVRCHDLPISPERLWNLMHQPATKHVG